MKRAQNKITESGIILPFMVVYAFIIWLLSGLKTDYWWLMMGCYYLTVFLIVELSNSNALLRVRSRMVSSVFIALSCSASFLFDSLSGTLFQFCTIASLLALFQSYQDPRAAGKTFYAFLFWGLGTLTFVQSFFFVPFLWIMMATQMQSLSVRTLAASLFGLIAPYWFLGLWCIYQQDFSWIHNHFVLLVQQQPYSIASLTVGKVSVFAITLLLGIISIVHLWQYSYEDKIRIRLIYGFFRNMFLASILFLILQPQYYDILIRIILIMASPMIAHFFTLTSNRMTNILFFVSMGLIVIITVLNLWMPSLTF